MDNAGLASLSDTLFWVALAACVVAMAVFFLHLSVRRAGVGVVALGLAGAGAAALAGSVVTRGFAAGRVPWGNMYEYSSVVGLLLVAGFLVLAVRRPAVRTTGGFAMGVAVVTLVAARGLYAPAGPLVPALNSWWLKVHVISAIAASSIFSIGFVFTLLYLVKDRSERRAAFTGSTVGAASITAFDDSIGMPADHLDAPDEVPDRAVAARGIVARLPKAATLDMLAYRTIAVAFPIWTWAVIAGAIWASKAWGRYWGWDPKETWAFITWVVYAGYLHARATRGVRGRGAALIACFGFVSLWITYYVVNLWIVGLHSYAGVD